MATTTLTLDLTGLDLPADEAAVKACELLEARTGLRACYRVDRGVVTVYLF